MRAFTAAALQVAPLPGPVDAGTVKANAERCLTWVERCVADTRAQLVVTPEAVTTGFDPALSAEELWDAVSEIPGPVTDAAAETAARLGVHLVWGTYERGPERGVVHNAAVLLGPSGDVLGVYRKTHLYWSERRELGGWCVAGDDAVVVDTPLARIGIVICFDGDYPELCRVEAVRGAEVIVRPSAFLRSADLWELTTRARAYDNHVHVVAANAVGADPAGGLYFGNSLLVTPTAAVVARGTTHEGWVAGLIDPDALQRMSPGSSVPQLFDHLADRNTALYARWAEELAAPARTSYPHPQRP